jgi:hypothetical protein
MIAGTNISQFRNFINDASPEDLVAIAPLVFSRIGTLDPSHQQSLIQKIQSDPQSKAFFNKLQTVNQ